MEKKKSLSTILSDPKKFITVFLLGFSSGLPIMVVYASIKLWLRRYEIDLPKIGLFSWIATSYSFNFLWAFFFDRYTPFRKFGRRRSWLLITQVCLAGSFVLLSFGDPSKSLSFIAIAGILLCFFSASQDVAVDAYRNEILDSEELGIGASLGVYGYRIAMWVASGFGIWVVDQDTWGWSFNQMFLMLAAFMGVGILATLWADEPEYQAVQEKTLLDSIVNPFFEFLKRNNSFLILAFIFFFKLGDSIAGSMSRPFYADLGFANKEIGAIASTVGLFSTLAGLIVGGSMIYKLGYKVTLWFAGITQAITTALFAGLAFVATQTSLGAIVFLEDFASGIGTAALVGFMGHLTNKRFTASQYALFASLASLGRTIFSGAAGSLIEYFKTSPVIFSDMQHTGYINFYVTCAIIAIPGLVFLGTLTQKEFE